MLGEHGFQWNCDKPSRVYPLSSPWWYCFQCINRISLVWNKFLCANTWSCHSRYLLGKLQDHFNLTYHVPTCKISLLLLTCCFLFTFHFHFCRLFWITWPFKWCTILHIFLTGCQCSLQGMVLITVAAFMPSTSVSCDMSSSCLSSDGTQNLIFFVALYLTAVGCGGVRSALLPFGADQFNNEHSLDIKRRRNFFSSFYMCHLRCDYIRDHYSLGSGKC